MKTRKIILLSLIAILLCVYIIQLASTGKGSMKQVTLDGEPDRIVIESAINGKIILTKKDDVWYLGEKQQYDTLSSEVNTLIDSLSYSILQTVSKGGDEILYGLDDDEKISVAVYQGDAILTQFDVGKDASTSLQSYIRMAGSSDILLISDSFHRVWNVSADDVRVRTVYSYSDDAIVRADLISNDAGVIDCVRTDDGVWISNFEEMDPDKIESWISTISTLNAAGWLPDDWTPEEEPFGAIMFKLDDGTIVQNTIYAIEGEEDRYIGTSSVCPYAYYMSAYTAGKFIKTVDDFVSDAE